MTAQIETQQLLVRNKSELRTIDCVNVMDYTSLRCYVTRTDTGEVIQDRRLTEDEKQSTLPFDAEDEPSD